MHAARLIRRRLVRTLGCALVATFVAFLPLGRTPVVADETAPPKKKDQRPTDGAAAAKAVARGDLARRIERAIARGVAYLVKTQRKDGSWGGPAPNLHVDIYAPRPGSNRAFTVGASGLALSALVEVGGRSPEVRAAVAKGTAYLLRHYGVRRPRPDTLYNTWSYMYSLEAFARLLAVEKRAEPRKRLLKAAAGCVSWLERMEFVEGGWGYFNFSIATAKPGPGATTFSTATGVVALEMARRQGVAVPDGLIRKADKLLHRCAIPGSSFVHS